MDLKQTSSFVMKHKIPIMFAIAAIVVVVLSIALKKKEKYYDYETSIPKPPAWVQGDPEKSPVFARRKAGARNANIVQTANKKKERYDFVLYGDSITMIAADSHMDVWNKYFGENGMKSAPLGIGGDTVQNLSWRVALGKERFAIPPKVVGLLIGINNQGRDNTDPVKFLDSFLLPYLKAVYPTTKFILIGLIPNTLGSTKDALRRAANVKYVSLAKKYGMQYVDISKGLVPSDKKQFFDGIHPTGAGYEILYSNLQPYVLAALKGQTPPSPEKPSVPTNIPKPPAWVQGDPEKSPVFARRKAGARNANIVQTANKKKERYDFVLYGDSITMIAADSHMDVWNKYFGENGMKSAPLGIGGDTVQNLSWRVALGKERFAIPPKVVGLLIGINNQGADNTDPAAKLYQFLLPYLKAVYPTSKFILIGLLPNNLGAARNAVRVKANANYRLLANKFGMQYVDISKGLVPSDKKQFFDGTHPTGAGYEILYSNLQPYVMAALKNVK